MPLTSCISSALQNINLSNSPDSEETDKLNTSVSKFTSSEIINLLTRMSQQVGVQLALDIFIENTLEVSEIQATVIWVRDDDKLDLISLNSKNKDLLNIINQSNFLNPLRDNLEQILATDSGLEINVLNNCLCIPLINFGQIQGVITLFIKNLNPDKINTKLINWIQKLTPTVSTLVYEHRLRLAAKSREQALSLLLKETEILVRAQSEEELLRDAGEMAMEILTLNSGFFLMQNRQGLWQIQAPFGLLKNNDKSWQTEVENYINVTSQRGLLQSRGFTSINLQNEILGFEGSLYIHPLIIHSGVVGQLWLNDLNERAAEKNREILTAFVRGVGVALETIRQREQLKLLAMNDTLTGVLNRQGFEKRILNEMAASVRRKTSFLLLSLDLDGFKKINDTKGHLAGDVALKQIAHLIKKSVREQDVVARTGGDEFAVVLTDIKLGPEAHQAIERIRNNLFLSNLGLGVSIGVAEFPLEASDFNTLYRLADQRLYTGKGTGKGKIVTK